MIKKVIISSPILLEEGTFRIEKITAKEARKLVEEGGFENFCTHQTTKIIGVTPSRVRKECKGYDIAIAIKPDKRLDPREYSIKELTTIGYTIYKISRLPEFRLHPADNSIASIGFDVFVVDRSEP